MGTAFKLRLAHCNDLATELMQLRWDGFETLGAMLSPSATELEQATRQARSVLVLGNEGHGLTGVVAAACTRHVKLEMRRGVDSLNVSVASGVFLYHFLRQAQSQS